MTTFLALYPLVALAALTWLAAGLVEAVVRRRMR